MKLGIDIDDTIANTYQQAKKTLLEEQNHIINDDDIYYNDPVVIEYYLKNSEKASSLIFPKDNAVEVINNLKKEGYEIYFLTSRRSDLYETTYNWLINCGFNFDKLYVDCAEKDEVCENLGIDCFIDDSIKHVKNVRKKGIKAYLFNSYFNSRFDEEGRVNNWIEIYSILTKYN